MMRRPNRVPPQPALRILGVPTALALGSLAGLVLGLTGHGWRDLVSVMLLLIPVLLFVWFWQHRAQN